MLKTIVSEITIETFYTLLKTNPGLVIIKLGAEWCKPCQQIKSNVEDWFSVMPNHIQTVLIDIDESFQLYSLLKNKKMLHGIPAILMYKAGNTTFIPDEIVNSSNINEVDAFFMKSLKHSQI